MQLVGLLLTQSWKALIFSSSQRVLDDGRRRLALAVRLDVYPLLAMLLLEVGDLAARASAALRWRAADAALLVGVREGCP